MALGRAAMELLISLRDEASARLPGIQQALGGVQDGLDAVQQGARQANIQMAALGPGHISVIGAEAAEAAGGLAQIVGEAQQATAALGRLGDAADQAQQAAGATQIGADTAATASAASKAADQFKQALGGVQRELDGTQARAEALGLQFDNAAGRWRNASGQFASSAQLAAAGIAQVDAAGSRLGGGVLAGALQTIRGQLDSVVQSAKQLTAGLAVGGVLAFGAGVTAAAGAGLAFNNSLEQTSARIQAFTKDAAQTAAILEMVKVRAAETPFAFEEMAAATAALMPAAKLSGAELEHLIGLAEILAASNPMEGLADGAAFALKEALSGDFESIVERFNLSRQYLNQLKDQGVPALEAVSLAMQQVGLDADLVTGLAGTLQGRWSTFQDTLTNVAATATKPIFTLLSNGLATVNNWLTKNQPMLERLGAALAGGVTSAINAFGRTIGPAASAAFAFVSAIAGASDPLQKFFQLLDGVLPGLGAFAKQAFGWGQALVQQFASGMAAAFNAVVSIVRQLGAIIATWLQPNSPPKILPNIDDWGTEAGQLYVDGIGRADPGPMVDSMRAALTGALEQVGDAVASAPPIPLAAGLFDLTGAELGFLDEASASLQGVLQAMEDVGQVKEQDVIPRLLGGREALMDAINDMRQFGSVSEASMRRIMDAAGPLGPQVGALVRSYADLQRATEDVARAQAELTRVTEEYDAKIAPLNEELRAIQDQKRAIDDQKRLRDLQQELAEGGLDELDVQEKNLEIQEILARQRIDAVEREREGAVAAAEAEVKRAEQAQQAAQGQVNQAKAQLDAYAQQNTLIREQTELLKRLAEEGKAGGGGGGGAGAGISIPTPTAGDSPFGAAAQLAQDAGVAIDDARQRYEDFKTTVGDTATTVQTTVAPALQVLNQIGATLGPVIQPVVDLIGNNLEPILISVAAILAGAVASAVLTAIGAFLAAAAPITALIALGAVLVAAWQGNFGGIRDFVLSVFGTIGSYIPAVMQAISAVVSTVLATINGFWQTNGSQIMTFASTTWEQIKSIIGGAVELIMTVVVGTFQIIADFISQNSADIQTILSGAWSVIQGVVSGAVAIVQGVIQAALAIIRGDWQGAWDAIRTMVEAVWSAIGQIITGALQVIVGQFNITLRQLTQVWGEAFNLVRTVVQKALVDIVALFAGFAAQAIQLGANIVGGIIQGVKAGAGELYNTLRGMAEEALQTAMDTLLMRSPSRAFADQVGYNIPAGVAVGVIDAIGLVRAAVAKMGEEALRELEGMAQRAAEMLEKGIRDGLDSAADLARAQARSIREVRDLLLDPREMERAQAAAQAAHEKLEKLDADAGKAAADRAQKRADLQEEIARLQVTAAQNDDPEKREQAAAKALDLQRQISDLDQQDAEERAEADRRRAEAQAALLEAQQKAADLETRRQRLAQIAATAQKQLSDALVASQGLDPTIADDYYQLRQRQILELADLQAQLAAATSDADRLALEQQIALVGQAQADEQRLFQRQAGDVAKQANDLRTQLQALLAQLGANLPAQLRQAIEALFAGLPAQQIPVVVSPVLDMPRLDVPPIYAPVVPALPPDLPPLLKQPGAIGGPSGGLTALAAPLGLPPAGRAGDAPSGVTVNIVFEPGAIDARGGAVDERQIEALYRKVGKKVLADEFANIERRQRMGR